MRAVLLATIDTGGLSAAEPRRTRPHAIPTQCRQSEPGAASDKLSAIGVWVSLELRYNLRFDGGVLLSSEKARIRLIHADLHFTEPNRSGFKKRSAARHRSQIQSSRE